MTVPQDSTLPPSIPEQAQATHSVSPQGQGEQRVCVRLCVCAHVCSVVICGAVMHPKHPCVADNSSTYRTTHALGRRVPHHISHTSPESVSDSSQASSISPGDTAAQQSTAQGQQTASGGDRVSVKIVKASDDSVSSAEGDHTAKAQQSAPEKVSAA